MIYFIEAVGTGMVKIGFTHRSAETRIKAFATHTPFEIKLLATCPGTKCEEKTFHKMFSEKRVRGEWFLLDEDISEYIREMGFVEDGGVGRRDVTIKGVDVELWTKARMAQISSGLTMAAWLEEACLAEIHRRSS